jgi:hypothetical protein
MHSCISSARRSFMAPFSLRPKHSPAMLLAHFVGDVRGSRTSSGSPLWLKVKNPNAPAVKREAEEDWGR